MPIFLGSFAATFLFATSMLMHFTPVKTPVFQTKQQAATIHLSNTTQATTSAVIFGPMKPTEIQTTSNESPPVLVSPKPKISAAASSEDSVNKPTLTPIQSALTDTPTPTPAHTMFTDTAMQSLPTITPTPTVIAVSNQSTVSTNTSPESLDADLIFSLVNQHRNSIGLPSFEKDSNTCTIAASRAPQIYNEIYVTNTMHAGLHPEQYSYWLTENIISMDTEQHAVNWWLNDTIHRKAIEGNYKYSCVACSSHSCSEIFTSYVAK